MLRQTDRERNAADWKRFGDFCYEAFFWAAAGLELAPFVVLLAIVAWHVVQYLVTGR